MTTFTKFSDCDTAPNERTPTDVTISGTPIHTGWPHFISADGKTRSGVWQSTAGVFRGPMNDQIEFCHILEGEALIKTEDGKEFTVKSGDAFVMDNGLQPIWHVDNFVKKHFVIVAVPASE
ncbi:cupin domain-containing protein [Psychromonas sp. SA13A]|uniref:cupin domain-containing protein n=1 Tax=Psychromonas sp. SA13A TaxID=2686346 RepID=UPI00140D27E0|nr:cupin domain-containing protein [Psychromonas sp. SA13A]